MSSANRTNPPTFPSLTRQLEILPTELMEATVRIGAVRAANRGCVDVTIVDKNSGALLAAAGSFGFDLSYLYTILRDACIEIEEAMRYYA